MKEIKIRIKIKIKNLKGRLVRPAVRGLTRLPM